MVLEGFFKENAVLKRPYLSFFFGFIFCFVGFGFAYLIFRSTLSVTMVFLTTLLLMPTMIKLLDREEKIERKEGLKHFFKNHKQIIQIYLFSFLGAFVAFFVLGNLLYNTALFEQVFEFQSGIADYNLADLENFNPESYGISEFFSIFSHNIFVMLICFGLAFFYGGSAIFLIILNSSVFARFLIQFVRDTNLSSFFYFIIHLLPELSGFLVAAIAGGVVSKAVLVEKRGTKAFRNVFKDAFILIGVAAVLILIGALLEVFVTSNLFQIVF